MDVQDPGKQAPESHGVGVAGGDEGAWCQAFLEMGLSHTWPPGDLFMESLSEAESESFTGTGEELRRTNLTGPQPELRVPSTGPS